MDFWLIWFLLCFDFQGSCPGDIINSNFTSNVANQAGGAHWINVAQTLTVYGNTYTYNNATTGSAGIFAQGVVNSTFANLHFGNNVGEKGGAMFQGNCNSTAITNSTFYNNSATTFGGAVFRSLTTGGLTNSYFSSNSAGRFGGAVYDVNVTGRHSKVPFYNQSVFVTTSQQQLSMLQDQLSM